MFADRTTLIKNGRRDLAKSRGTWQLNTTRQDWTVCTIAYLCTGYVLVEPFDVCKIIERKKTVILYQHFIKLVNEYHTITDTIMINTKYHWGPSAVRHPKSAASDSCIDGLLQKTHNFRAGMKQWRYISFISSLRSDHKISYIYTMFTRHITDWSCNTLSTFFATRSYGNISRHTHSILPNALEPTRNKNNRGSCH